ncbi:MAG: peptidoglycan bridge formation glycyltransferase FemA/FemB family protein, partial [Anaerolineales bacterium]|nr:peptidoglycan bridge formation glycyltransferase FemA/FemB family protein [Anaerolineales bacterium]
MPELSLADWRTFLEQHPEAHLLQSGEWGELKSAFGWQAVRVVNGEIGAQILFRRLPLGYSFAYIPKGPLGTDPGSFGHPEFWREVDTICRRRRAIFLKVEPDGWQETLGALPPLPPGFRRSPHHIQPRVTLVLDLSGREEDVFERMKPKTRYNIRLAGRKEVEVHASD